MPTIRFRLNGQPKEYSGDPAQPLLWHLRDDLGLIGSKYGCGIGACGACTVHLNGDAARSCLLPMAALADADIRTVEGLADGDQLHPVQQAWIDHDVAQCGYCQAGQIMAASALLEKHPQPSEAQVESAMNGICRCGTYFRMRKAIASAAGQQPKRGEA